jgi:hypothetical protein
MPVGVCAGRHFLETHRSIMAINFRFAALACAALLTLAFDTAAAQEFSANVASTNEKGEPAATPGRVFVAGGKVHLELPDFPDAYFLVDPAAGVAYFVKPARRVFMEARQSSPLAQILIVVDPDKPCEQWQAVALITGLASEAHSWQCQRLEAGRLGARDTVRYQAIAPDGRSYDVWIDRTLRFPIKVRAAVGAVVDITDIVEAPPPPTAFEIPAGFSKFDPQGLIDRIKQSDVWVDQPQPR